MKSFFETMTWPRSTGRLHVYAFANPAVATMAGTYHRHLAELGVSGLPRQPDAFLHVTIEQIQRYVDDVSDEQLRALTAALSKQIAAVPAFDLIVGPALVGYSGIYLDAAPDEPWQRLRQAVRAAAVEVFGDDAVNPMRGPGAPHLTLAYAMHDLELEQHVLQEVRAGRATLPVHEVHLVAVSQDASAGVYSWTEPIAALPLGPSAGI